MKAWVLAAVVLMAGCAEPIAETPKSPLPGDYSRTWLVEAGPMPQSSFVETPGFNIQHDVEVEATVNWKTVGNSFSVDLRVLGGTFEASHGEACTTGGKALWGPWAERCRFTGVENVTVGAIVRSQTSAPDEYTVTVTFRELAD